VSQSGNIEEEKKRRKGTSERDGFKIAMTMSYDLRRKISNLA
jgi:hypothetical protein